MARYAYLHGFGSSSGSRKGVALAAAFWERGVQLPLLDLNRPSFQRLSHLAALEALDDMDRGSGQSLCLIGSSLGGWLAARWAELNPSRVERLVLLCPGFDLAGRWPAQLGPEKMRQWESSGALPFPDSSGVEVPVHYAFYRALLGEPSFPDVHCPTLVMHGVRDEIVPVHSSREFAAKRPHVRLLEFDDDHALVQSLSPIARETVSFLGL